MQFFKKCACVQNNLFLFLNYINFIYFCIIVLETVRISRIISSTQGFVLIWQIQLPTIDGFLLNVFKVDGQNTISLVKQKDVNSPVRAFHVTGLKRGTLYQFEIRAKNGDRYGRATKILRMF